METTPASTPRRTRPALLLLALAMTVAGCTSAQPNKNQGGTGDTGGEGDPGDTGGKTGGTGGKTGGSTGGKTGGDTGGSTGSTGGSTGMGTGGAPAQDSGMTETPPDAATGTMADSG